VPLEDLEHGPRVLQRVVVFKPGVFQRRPATAVMMAGCPRRGVGSVLVPSGCLRPLFALIGPGREVVLPGLWVES